MDMHADDPFATSFEYASGKTAERFQNPLYQLTEPILGKKFRKSIDIVKRFGKEIVASAIANRKQPDDKQTASQTQKDSDSSLDDISGSLVNSLLDSIDDHQMVADAALNYLSAGRALYFPPIPNSIPIPIREIQQ